MRPGRQAEGSTGGCAMNDVGDLTRPSTPAAAAVRVKHFRQILLWPVYLMPLEDGGDIPDYWADITAENPDNPWREVADEFTGDPTQFQERHYNEFVAFLPPVQRFLYGQGLGKAVRSGYGESPIRVMRRCDIDKIRVTLSKNSPPLTLNIAHLDLYLFFDIDVAMLALEVYADDLPLSVAQELMFQLGRAYPAAWEADGSARHCPWRVEWLSAAGDVLSTSDYEQRQKYLTFVCQHRGPCVATHWEYAMRPLVLNHTDQKGLIRYRQLEYYRMPVMAFLALEAPERLTRADYVRLTLASGPGDSDKLPFDEKHYADFETKHCYDSFREVSDGQDRSGTRYLASGHAFVAIGNGTNPSFTNLEHGYLARFRHQHFLLFLIAHFHRAALLMFSDQLAAAVNRLDISNPEAVAAFRYRIRQALETFLRFTHRYWFTEVSDQAQSRDLFALCRRHLGIDQLYGEVRHEVQDMSSYLESEAARRQNETMVRLTVVTTFGLIGTVATGVLGMNLFALAEEPVLVRVLAFILVVIPTTLITLYTVRISRRLSEFFDALSNRSGALSATWRALRRIW